MENPNTCQTTFRQTTSNFIIKYMYGSKNMAQHDYPAIKDTYTHATSVTIEDKTVTVTVPLKQ